MVLEILLIKLIKLKESKTDASSYIFRYFYHVAFFNILHISTFSLNTALQ